MNLRTVLANKQSVYIVLKYKPQTRKGFRVLYAAGYEVDSCSFYAAVSQHVRELCDISACPVKYSCEQVAQVVREYF